MENSTLFWIGNTIFYIVLFLLFLVLSRFVFNFIFPKMDVDNELTNKDNVAFGITITGFFVAVLIIYLGVVQGDSYGYLADFIIISFYGIIGLLLLFISSKINEKVIFKKKFSIRKEIIKDQNNGTAFIEAANFIGSALIIYGAISGKTLNFFEEFSFYSILLSGLLSLIVLWLIGQVLLNIVLKLYTKFSNYDFYNQIQKDNNAVGIVYASVLISVAYLYSQAIKGDLLAWDDTLENVAYYLGVGIILLPFSRWIVDKIILPKSKLIHEITQQEIPNQGAALIEAFAYLGSAVLISYCI